MSKLFLRVHTERLIGTELYYEASKEELRVLLAAIAADGESSEEELSAVAKCSPSRCKSALTLFSEEGVIEMSGNPFESGEIIYEHGTRSHFSDLEEDLPTVVAENIKKHDLADIIDECATMTGRTALSSSETAKLVSLIEKFSLDGEYIITLLDFIKSKGKPTIVKLVSKAENLISRGIDSFEALNDYIANCERPGYVYEFRRVFGIYNSAPSDTELVLYKKWAEEFGYSTKILALAYDQSVLAGARGNLAYIDKALSAWHAAGCNTVEECEANRKAFKDAKEAEKKEHSQDKRPRQKSKPEPPRYGDFDVEEAFKLALSRSYGDSENSEK